MANSTTEKTKAVPAEPVSMMSVLAPAVGWLIPGAGHMIQKRWIRGVLLFVSIVTLFLLGLAMQGRIYKPTAAISSTCSASSATWARAAFTS